MKNQLKKCPDGQFFLTNILLAKEGLEENNEGYRLMQLTSEQGQTMDLNILGMVYFDLPKENIALAKFYLGKCYAYGYGVKVDLNKANKLFIEAEDNYEGNVLFLLGEFYETVEGKFYDPTKALECYALSSNLGNIDAIKRISNLQDILKYIQ